MSDENGFSEKRYVIHGLPGDPFITGAVPDKRQFIMGFFWSGLTAIEFRPDGSFLGGRSRPLPTAPSLHPVTGIPLMTIRFAKEIDRALNGWAHELGIKFGAICVCRFRHEGLEIRDLPSGYESFLADPDSMAPDKLLRARMEAEIRQWREDGSFVLLWGNDYWMSSNGQIQST